MRYIFLGLAVLLSACQFAGSGLHPFLSDASITTAVNEAFVNNDQLSTVPIQVDSHQGVVTLNGYVKTIRQNDLATEVASTVPGVKSVQNNLIVRK